MHVSSPLSALLLPARRRQGCRRLPAFTAGLALLAAFHPVAQEELDVTKFAGGVQRVPIALSGFSGQVAAVLSFDLEVAGFAIVSEEQAEYVLKGSHNGQVEGHLTHTLDKKNLVDKVFTGGGTRVQAHALADEVVAAVTGKPGIARTKIAFKALKNGNSEVYLADYDGHNATALTHDNTVVAAPCWVPGQRKLYYTTFLFGNADIIAHDLTTGARPIIARYSGSNMSPAASPDGRQVAMILSKSGSPDLFVADADGSHLRQLAQTREDESSPCWSPDGDWICFATRMNGRRVLAKVPSGGGKVQRIPIAEVLNPSEPDWSPDGKWIVFTAQMGSFQLCVVPAQGGDARVLAPGEDPSWAPNSRTVAFTRRVGPGKRVISLLDVPTKQFKDTAHSLGACSQPSWAR
jgi:TolB protein